MNLTTMSGGDRRAGWLEADCLLRQIIAVYDFSLRERIVLDALLARSISIGRARALFERLRDWAERARISRGNLCEILGRLKRARVIQEQPAGRWGINPLHQEWRIPARMDASAAIEQQDLDPPEPDLVDGSIEALVDNPRTFLGMTAVHSVPESVCADPVGFAVRCPESGTDSGQAFPNRERSGLANNDGPPVDGSRIGNGSPYRDSKESFKVSAVQSFETAETLKSGLGKRLSITGKELAQEVRLVVGEGTWANWAGC